MILTFLNLLKKTTKQQKRWTPDRINLSGVLFYERKVKTNNKKTYLNDTDLSFLPGGEPKGSDDYAQYESYFRSKLEIPILIQNSPMERETLEGILDLLAETCSSKRKTIRIAGDDKPIEVVKSRLMKLNTMHIQFVLECLKENTTYVRDMKQYLLTTLFNAPVTIDSYYRSRVNHDYPGIRA